MNLNLPLDFERMPEFWQLAEVLRTATLMRTATLNSAGLQPAEFNETAVNEAAVLLWLRLWVVLGYLARHTNRPGWLNAAGERQVNAAFTQFGDDCPPVKVLADGGLLVAVSAGTEASRRDAGATEDGWMCPLFAQLNAHLSGDYMSKEVRGNRASRIAAAKHNIAATAAQQAQLLPEDVIFQKRDGTAITGTLVQRCIVLVMTLDRCLVREGEPVRARPRSSYTAGLMADAAAAMESVTADELSDFYNWLAGRVKHPSTPRTAEEVLSDWEAIYRGAKLKNG